MKRQVCIVNYLYRRTYSSHLTPQVLEFTKRNEKVIQNLPYFYPSLSNLPNPTISISKFNEKYKSLNEDLSDARHIINGKIKSIRIIGKNMCFINLVTGDGHTLQSILNYNLMKRKNDLKFELTNGKFQDFLKFLKNGDFIQVNGFPGLSLNEKTLSLKCLKLPQILSISQFPLPPKLTDPIKRKQNHVVDYLVNGREMLIYRHKILKTIREFLDSLDFIEVETPILSNKSNGANAQPFITISKDLGASLELRVSPELWLKRLNIGGIDKVYEIGKVFRNESIDSTHNPEFTSLEFYQTYTSMEEMIKLSERLIKYICSNVDTPLSKKLLNEIECNNGVFNRIEFLPTLSKELNIDFSSLDLNDSDRMLKCLKNQGVILPSSISSPQQILNKLCGDYIEDKYCQSLLPCLIYHHPTVMSPLAKGNPDDNMQTTKRFEIFIQGKEYINAYEEENCPQLQLEKFINQQLSKKKYNDKESLEVDHQYVNAMKWGMPPIAGFGLGVDRLCMLLLGKERIEDVLSFGSIDDVNRQ